MSSVLQSVKAECTIPMGQVEFSRGTECEVVTHNTVDFFTHGLDCDCNTLVSPLGVGKRATDILAISDQLEPRLLHW